MGTVRRSPTSGSKFRLSLTRDTITDKLLPYPSARTYRKVIDMLVHEFTQLLR